MPRPFPSPREGLWRSFDTVPGTRSLPRLRSLLLAVLLIVPTTEAVSAQQAQASTYPTLRPFRGLGSWIDIYDPRLWRAPEAVIDRMHALGVRTLFLETGNWRIESRIFRPLVVARYLDEAHRLGMDVVGWYVPDFMDPVRDLRRALAAVRFVTARGERFDSLGLDIESSELRDVPLRTRRTVRLSAAIREAVGPGYPLAAIVPSPLGLQHVPAYWPGFPFRRLAELYDVFVPMEYFTFRTDGPAQARLYTADTIRLLRSATGDGSEPVHAIGGLAADTTGSEARAFVDAAISERAIGLSLYDFGTTGREDWAALDLARALAPRPIHRPAAPVKKATPSPAPAPAPPEPTLAHPGPFTV
jgi:hypothetical protein